MFYLVPLFLPDQGFNQTTEGLFYVEVKLKNWTEAEAECQRYGQSVHLATLDTQEVGTLMLT